MSFANQNTKRGVANWTLVLLAAVVIGAIVLAIAAGDSDDEDPTDTNGDNLAVDTELIRVESPQQEETIESPLVVSGEARGNWYFEGSFSVDIEDNAGNVLTTTAVQADGDWMTEDFVSFEEEIAFDIAEAETSEGAVVFNRANPSGLEENADSEEVSVVFVGVDDNDNDDSATTSVNVFWSDEQAAVDGDCTVVESFERSVPETQTVAQAALEELLAGPADAETESGYITNIPEDVTLNSIEVEDGIAYPDFSAELNEVGGSCRVRAINSQITETLLQFSSVEDVVISVDGETDEVLQP